MTTTPSEDVVPNYGKGLVTYITADMGTEEIKSDNIPQAIEDLVRFPLGQQLYIRPTWREIQPQPGRLQFPDYLKQVFDLSKKYDKRIGLRVQIVDQSCVVDVFDEARSKNRCGDAEDNVVGRLGLGEAGLRKAASARIGAAGDGVEVFDAAVRSVGIGVAVDIEEEREARLAHRPRAGDEGRNGVSRAVRGGIGNLRVSCWAGTADGGRCMAGSAAPGVETWSQAETRFNGAGN